MEQFQIFACKKNGKTALASIPYNAVNVSAREALALAEANALNLGYEPPFLPLSSQSLNSQLGELVTVGHELTVTVDMPDMQEADNNSLAVTTRITKQGVTLSTNKHSTFHEKNGEVLHIEHYAQDLNVVAWQDANVEDYTAKLDFEDAKIAENRMTIDFCINEDYIDCADSLFSESDYSVTHEDIVSTEITGVDGETLTVSILYRGNKSWAEEIVLPELDYSFPHPETGAEMVSHLETHKHYGE